MFSKSIVRSLMDIVPEKTPAVVTLLPGSLNSLTVNIHNAWQKPVSVSLSEDGRLNLQGDETLIKIPDHELNPAAESREIRPRDQIEISGTLYRVLSARLMSVRTVWECTCRKELV